MDKDRKIGLDIVRVIAIIFVLSVHFFAHTKYYTTSLSGKSMYIQTFIRTLFMSCVPLFMILTGYFSRISAINIKSFKKIIPILAIYLLYSLIAIIPRTLVLNEAINIKAIIIGIFNFTQHGYSWYINMYLGLFLLSPFLNVLYYNINDNKSKKILIGVLLILTSLPTFNRLVPIIKFPEFWTSIYPITYYFIGCYLKEYSPIFNKVYLSLALISWCLLETFIEIYKANGEISTLFIGEYSSPFLIIQTIIIFLIFYNINIKNKYICNCLSYISKLSLDMYLASYISDIFVYLYVLPKLNIESQSLLLLLLIPLVISSFLIALIISSIRNYLIRIENNTRSSNNTSIHSLKY